MDKGSTMSTTIHLAPDRTTVYRAWAGPRRLLGIWSHPDDESYLAAGLMDRVRRSGGEVTLLTVSDGEQGFPDDDHRPIDLRRRQRCRELRSAMASIGVLDLRLLGLPDGAVSAAPRGDLVRALRAAMDDVRPDLVVTFGPDGITGHPDHVATSGAATAAWLDYGDGELLYAAKTVAWLDEWRSLHDRVGLWMAEEPDGVASDDVELDLVLEAAPLDRKRRTLAHHASQTTAVAEVMGEATYRRWIAQETFRRPTGAELAGASRPFARAVA